MTTKQGDRQSVKDSIKPGWKALRRNPQSPADSLATAPDKRRRHPRLNLVATREVPASDLSEHEPSIWASARILTHTFHPGTHRMGHRVLSFESNPRVAAWL